MTATLTESSPDHSQRAPMPLRWPLADLAPPRRTVRSTRGVIADVDIAGAARALGVAYGVCQRVFDAYCDAASDHGAAGFGMCDLPLSAIAARAGAGEHATRRAARVLRIFDLLRRRPRRWGPWATVVPAVLDHAAATPGTLEELWSRPSRPGRVDPWHLPASTASAAQAAALSAPPPPAAVCAPPGCDCRRLPAGCDLAWVTEHIAAIIGAQVRSRDWQEWLHAALQLGWTPPQLLHELVRDLHTARSTAAVMRTRLGVVTGRGRWGQHQCGDTSAVEPDGVTAAAPQAAPERARPLPPADPSPGVPDAPKNRQQSRSADSQGDARATTRKDLQQDSPPNPPPSGPRGERPSATARQLLTAACDLANASLGPAQERRLCAQLDSDGVEQPDRVLLGLVAETSTAVRPAALLATRVMNRADADRRADKYLAAAERWGEDAIKEPTAAAAFAHLRAERRSRRAAQRRAETARAAQRRAHATTLTIEQARRIAAAAQDASAAAAAILGRDLTVDEIRLTAHLAMGAVPLAARRSARMLASPGGSDAVAAAAKTTSTTEALVTALGAGTPAAAALAAALDRIEHPQRGPDRATSPTNGVHSS